MLTQKQKKRRRRYKVLSLFALGALCFVGVLSAALEGVNTVLKRQSATLAPYRTQSAREEAFLKTLQHGDLFTLSYGPADNRMSDCLRFVDSLRPLPRTTLTEVKASYLAGDVSHLLKGSDNTTFELGCSPAERHATLEAEAKEARRNRIARSN